MFSVEREGGVSILRMDDGKVNAIGPAFLEGFPGAWKEATAGGAAIVLAGNAKAFSAGLDLRHLPGLDRPELGRFVAGFVRLFAEVASHPGPVVAAVDGPALAGGAILALGADLRLLSPRARIGLTEVLAGVPFPPPVLDLVRATLPLPESRVAVLTGVVRSGEEAVRSGWADRIVPSETLVAEAAGAARALASAAPLPYAGAKRALSSWTGGVDEFVKDGLDPYLDLLASDATRDAVLAYFARLAAAKAQKV